MATTYKCFGCKESINKSEIIDYASPGSTVIHHYCKSCYNEKIAKDKFAETVCRIFGLKTPGPRIWKERQRLQEKYGYTDQLIVDCLIFLYEEKKIKKLSESLYLVNPSNINQMIIWKQNLKNKTSPLINAMKQSFNTILTPIQENTKSYVEELNPDDFLIDF